MKHYSYSTYLGVSGPANTFITIAGTSLPLALMSAFNFEAPDPDADDLSDDRAQNGYSSAGSTGVLRFYCTLFIGFCSFMSMLVLRMYKVKFFATIHVSFFILFKYFILHISD